MNEKFDPLMVHACGRFARLTAGLTVAMGALVLGGWALDIGLLKSVLPGMATMKPVTAAGFLLLGLALWWVQRRSGLVSVTDKKTARTPQALAAVAGLIGGLSAGEYFWSYNSSVEDWLFPGMMHPASGLHPDRMAFATALALIVYGASLLLLETGARAGRRSAQYLALFGTLIGLVPLMGYVYGVHSLYDFAAFDSMALHTAFLFTLFGLGVLCARPESGLMATVTSVRLGGAMSRRVLPLVFTLPFLLGWLRLKGQELGWYGTGFGLALLAAANVIVFAVVVWRSARILNRADTEREQLLTREQAARTEANLARSKSERIIEGINDAFIALDRGWNFIYVNVRAGQILSHHPGDLVGKHFWTIFPEVIGTPFEQGFRRAMSTQESVHLEEYYPPFERWFEIRIHPTPEGITMFFHDISVRKQAEAMLTGQKQILELVARGEPLSLTLDVLLRMLERQSPDMICSILLMDDDGVHVRHGAAPSLPAEFSRMIDGSPIGPVAGSCGTAAYRRESVFVADIAHDPLWADYKHLALPHGLLACWSTPIFDTDKHVLGTFAIYHREPGLPTARHNELIDFATHTAAICICRQRAEASLRVSEARYALAVRGTSDGLWDWNIRTGDDYLSPRWKELLGFADDELPNKADSFFGRLHPEDVPHALASVQAHLEQRVPYDIEIRLCSKNGEYRWFQTRGQAVWDDEGKPVRMAGAISDINLRKETEATLERERTQATTVLNSLSSHIAVVDRDGVVLAVNESWRRFARENEAGTAASVRPGVNYLSVVARSAAAGDKLAQVAYDGISSVLRGEQEHFELEYPCDAPGLTRRFLMIVTSVKGGAGAVLAHEDITKRKLAEQAVRNSAEFNRQIIASANEGIVVLDRELHYTVWNPFMENLLGLRSSEVLGRHPTELFPWVQEGGQLAAMERALAGETVVLKEDQRIKTGTKRISWLHAQLAPMRDAQGGIIGVIAAITDVSESKLAEIELRRSHEQLRALAARLQSVREEQSAHIAREIHDVLGQQLTALKLDLTWLKRRAVTIGDENLRKVLTEKMVSTMGLADDTIKTVQKVATELRPGLLDKLGLAAALEHEVRAFSERTGIQCETAIDRTPNPLDQNRAIDVFRVCQEMLTNVARHAQATQIKVRLAHNETQLVLEVRDNGRGISDQQLLAAKSLGLLGMSERAQLLGGTLDIHGADGKGTTAVLAIPSRP